MIKDYLIHCYLYYGLGAAVISDVEFDKLCKNLLANWRTQQSAYKKYISTNDLEAGTGFTLFYDHETGKRNYPKEIIEEAESRLVNHRAGKVLSYRVTTDNEDLLYSELKSCSSWFLIGLQADYTHFLKCNPSKQKMALRVIERILKERKDGLDIGETA